MKKGTSHSLMEKHLVEIGNKLELIKKLLLKDSFLNEDIDTTFDFVPPFSKSHDVSKIKLIIVGQDPTVRNPASRKAVKYTLNLDRNNSLKSYLKTVCNILNIDIDSEVYATNMYKCFFHKPPADDQSILSRHFKIWMDFLIEELSAFGNPFVITLGEPLLSQLVHSNSKKVKHYWDYIGNTKSGRKFKYIEMSENYLGKRIYPLPHQPTWSRNAFYKAYLTDYVDYIKVKERLPIKPILHPLEFDNLNF